MSPSYHYTLTICPDHTMGCGCRQTNLVKPYATPGIGTKPEWSIRITYPETAMAPWFETK